MDSEQEKQNENGHNQDRSKMHSSRFVTLLPRLPDDNYRKQHTGILSGRWTNEEHERFLKAVKKFPKGPWRKVADIVGSRTLRQTRTHADKYFKRLRKKELEMMNAPIARNYNKFNTLSLTKPMSMDVDGFESTLDTVRLWNDIQPGAYAENTTNHSSWLQQSQVSNLVLPEVQSMSKPFIEVEDTSFDDDEIDFLLDALQDEDQSTNMNLEIQCETWDFTL